MSNAMAMSIEQEIDALESMTTGDLAERFVELHGYQTRTRHRSYLIRKIAWRIQANAEGDLSERARKRAEELAVDAEVRVMAPKAYVTPPQTGRTATVTRKVDNEAKSDPRLPTPGSAIVREYKGRTVRVLVLPGQEGFECEGERFKTLSAVAKHITGSHINGFRFFRLGNEGSKR